MKSFTTGFIKAAASAKGVADTAKKLLTGAKEVGGGFMRGIQSAGDVALKKHLNPATAAAHLQEATKGTLKSKAGRQQIGTALGKAAPSIAATGAYAYGAKKLYDKTMGGGGGGGSYGQGGYY
jgi:hypothetical protein